MPLYPTVQLVSIDATDLPSEYTTLFPAFRRRVPAVGTVSRGVYERSGRVVERANRPSAELGAALKEDTRLVYTRGQEKEGGPVAHFVMR
jgi:hypothetical protein